MPHKEVTVLFYSLSFIFSYFLMLLYEDSCLTLRDSSSMQDMVKMQSLRFDIIIYLCIYLLTYYLPFPAACMILVSPPGIESVSSSVKMQSFNHWTAREVADTIF